MSLQVWLPLNGNLNNQGLSDAEIIVTGATVNASGKIGSCYSFDGSDDLISINCSDLYKTFSGGSQQFSVAFWVYHADATRAIIFGDYGLTGAIGFNIELTTGHQVRFYWNGSPDKNFAAAAAVAASDWTHIVLTYDGSKLNIYKNGILQSDSWSGTLATKNKTSGLFYLGRDSRTGTTVLNGRLNDFRIYNHALSVKEVEEISKGLVLHYKLDNNGQGQYNLLKDTNKGNYRWLAPSGNGTGTITSILIDGINCARYEMTVKSTNWCVFAFRPTNNVEVINTLHETNSYTLSFDIFPSQPINNAIPRYVDGNAQNNLINWPSFSAPANAWYHYEGTAISSGATQSNQSFYINYLFDIGTYDFKNLKIEIGTKATGYNVHIEESFLSNIIYDSSGYQHNGDLIGTITNSISTPRYNISTHFINGSYGRTQERPSICLPTDAITVNLWIRIDTWGNPISCTEGGGWNFENSSGVQFPVYVASVGYKVANSGVTPTTLGNTWHMLTGTFDKENVKIYIDGVLKKTTATGSTNQIGYANNYLFLAAEASGNNTSPANSTFVGDLSDLRIYCVALTENQIKELYNISATIDKNGNVYAREVQEI